MRTKKMLMVGALAALSVFASACSIDIERNADGSLGISTVLSAESFATEMERDPLHNDVDITVSDGVMEMTIDGVEETGEAYIAHLTVNLAAADGTLVVDITEATYNDWPLPEQIVDRFNRAIERELRVGARENPDASLVSLAADNNQIVTVWRVEDNS